MASDARSTARIEKSVSNFYDDITKDENSPFYGKEKTLVFLTAASLGFEYNKKSSLVGDRQDLFVVNLLKDKENLWLMKAIAIASEGVDVLKDLKRVTQICEDYANSGIHLLMDIYKNGNDANMALADAMVDSKE